jgi:GT2 family glycosyltransferase/glycosyltransferase involved in cell wall biosynthesis
MAKVALVAHEVQTVLDGRAGGVATFVTHFARLLRNAGEEVTLILTRQEVFPVLVDKTWRERYAEWGIHLIELHSAERSPNNWCEAWPAALSEQLAPYLDSFDIAYFQDWANVAFHPARLKRLGRPLIDGGNPNGTPVLVTVLHGPSGWGRIGNQLYPQLADDTHLEFVERYAARNSDLVVTPSRYLKHWAEENGWHWPSEPQVLGLPYFQPTNDVVRRPQRTTTRLVFFGRLETRKGVNLFVAGLRMLHRITPKALQTISSIVFLGEEQEKGTFARITGELAELDIPVTQIGNMDSVQANQYLTQNAPDSLVVVPSPAENFPYTVVEASSIPGIHLICSSGGGIPEVLGSGNEDHMFEPYPLGLAKKLSERLQEPERAASLKPYDADAANARWLQFHREACKLAPIQARDLPVATVDVCIPYYNKAETLPQLLEHLEHQTTQQFGVIVVNDGSCEAAAVVFEELAMKYADRGWKFVSQENAFVDAARNHAASLSSADYLFFIDADDLPAPRAIESMLHAITFSGDDCLIAGGQLFEGSNPPFDMKSGELSGRVLATYMPLGPDLATALIDPMVLGTSMILVKRAAFSAIGGYRPIRGAAHEDWELQIRLLEAGFRVEVLPEFLLYFRKSQTGLSMSSDGYEAKRRLLDTYEAMLTPLGLRGLATSIISLQKRCEILEDSLRNAQAAARFAQESRARILQGLAKEMMRRKADATQAPQLTELGE